MVNSMDGICEVASPPSVLTSKERVHHTKRVDVDVDVGLVVRERPLIFTSPHLKPSSLL